MKTGLWILLVASIASSGCVSRDLLKPAGAHEAVLEQRVNQQGQIWIRSNQRLYRLVPSTASCAQWLEHEAQHQALFLVVGQLDVRGTTCTGLVELRADPPPSERAAWLSAGFSQRYDGRLGLVTRVEGQWWWLSQRQACPPGGQHFLVTDESTAAQTWGRRIMFPIAITMEGLGYVAVSTAGVAGVGGAGAGLTRVQNPALIEAFIEGFVVR